MENIDLTYSGKLKTLINVMHKENLDVNYTVEGKNGKVTTTSIKICDEPLFMITFNYQDLKKLVGDDNGK